MVSIPTNDSNESNEAGRKMSHRASSTELKWSTVSPQVQSNVAVLFISNGSGSWNEGNPGSSTNCAINENDADGSSGRGMCSNPNSLPTPSGSAGKEKSKDVVFCWPKESESKMVKALAASQGMFSTLYRLLWDVTGSHPLS